MNTREKLKESQGYRKFVQLDVVKRIDLRQAEDKSPVFSYYNGTENVQFTDPIVGIFIGNAMVKTAYSDNIGSKGGTYRTNYHVSNKDMVLFEGSHVVAKGDESVIADYILKNATGTMKKRMVFFVATHEGLVAIETNMTIGIDQLNKNRLQLLENEIIVNPKLYSPDDTEISNKAKGFLGKLAKTNPPKYAWITIGQPISDEMIELCNLDAHIDNFIKWKKFQTAKPEEKEPEIHISESVNENIENNLTEKNTEKNTEIDAPVADMPASVSNTDDLPF